MGRIFITGSSDGLGLLAAERLIDDGHDVTLHARNEPRAEDARLAAPGAEGVLVGDLASLHETRRLADRANVTGPFDAVIHNAGVYLGPRAETGDGFPRVVQINVLAPYLLTALMLRPKRLVYLTSGLSRSGVPDLGDLTWTTRDWDGMQAYADSKLWIATLSSALARRWPEVRANAVNPGWVPTKMGGAGAPDDLAAGAETQVWLAAGEGAAADLTGEYLFHQTPSDKPAGVDDEAMQEALLHRLERLTGVGLPPA